MRDEKEERRKKERSKQGQTNKQGKATQHELPQVGLEPTTLYTLDRAHVCVAIIPMSISSNVTKLNSRVHYSGEVVE